jgi:hypothetical protein
MLQIHPTQTTAVQVQQHQCQFRTFLKKIKCSSTIACFHVQQFTKSFELDDC